jgi:DNA polymerase-3 subunit delta
MGLALSPSAVALLADLIGNDLRALSQELEKLGTYAQGRPITEDDVRLLVSASREASVLAMVDAVVEGRSGVAIRLLEQLQNEGAAPTYLLNMITRQYRHLIMAKELLLARLSAEEISHRLGIASDFALRKVLEQAARYSLPPLEAAYRRLLEADAAIKRGIYGDELALELLLEELSRIARWREAPAPAL